MKRFSTRAYRVAPGGGCDLSVQDPTASLEVWILPSSIAMLRWPNGGLVRSVRIPRWAI